MTKQEAGAILEKFQLNVEKHFVLDLMNINKNATLGYENIQMLVRLLHNALPWPDPVGTRKVALLLNALEHVAANCSPCKTDHAGPALEKYGELMSGDNPPSPSGNTQE